MGAAQPVVQARVALPCRGCVEAVQLDQLQRPRQTHGRREGFRRMDAHLVAERRQQDAGVELHPLAFLEPARAR
jgi:hypothetical protein